MPREVKPRCGYETRVGGTGPLTGKKCDLPAGHPGRHHSGVMKHRKIWDKIERNDPEHSRTWGHRERRWRTRGITCLPGCVNNKGWLCREHYNALWEFQDGKCGVCGGLLLRVLPYPSSDHAHIAPDGSGPIRGILHGGKTGCNIRHLARWEKGYSFEGEDGERMAAACAAYVASPPSAKLAALEGTPFPEGTCFVSVISPSKAITLDNFKDPPPSLSLR